ncbi:MAG: multidrug ABC transporter substrate-binding protein [Candidatus Kerfeldbacteria bacterium CG_4_10_14_0_8_um_filter_42_10]|uniref:Multidrug ABC transporter substrate-binding protein n=1 Tax=Candidatus Kerfeldbacteria bacterium CG_4_10_14_0_8_um_filter_42_10 TaxID=2014248 RepID=A0A2M7RKA6_9BACT|nr:MAG: multidrug ABC transporter substrate-binding protein [Candidatus Kerfeldbacteria bacterium CG_4_10_14_0_8_um_filter_42_10]
MNILESIRFAFAAIWANKLRSLLTMLGIIIGVFSVITLVSIGSGVQNEFAGAVDSFGGNMVAVISGDIEAGGMGAESFMTMSSLTIRDVEAIESVENVSAAAPLMLVPSAITPPDKQPYLPMVIATTDKMSRIMDIKVTEGRHLQPEDLDNKARVILVGRDAASQDFTGSPIGQKVTVLEEEFEVIGVIETDMEFLGGGSEKNDFLSNQLPNLHEAYVMPITTAEDILETLNIFRIMIDFKTTEAVPDGVEQIKTVILEQHKGIKDFSVLTTEDLLDLFDQFFGILTSAVVGIAAISLIVGGIGIMNIMLVSVTERTREIGIRKALGATGGNILFQFLVESGVLSLIGGFIGVLLSFAVTQIITQYAGIPTLITAKALILSVGVSVGVGIIFGLMPASKAARKNPIDALRYE